MKIENSTPEDIAEIFHLYDIATQFQKERFSVYWPQFESALIEKEINENRQWKIVIDNQIACVWATAFDDSQIWEKRNIDPSVYIHRIATNPKFRGQNMVSKIIEWARPFAFENQKEYLRMDTVGDNTRLIAYYEKCGFNFLGLQKLKNTAGLPAHYDNATVSLFELPLKNS